MMRNSPTTATRVMMPRMSSSIGLAVTYTLEAIWDRGTKVDSSELKVDLRMRTPDGSTVRVTVVPMPSMLARKLVWAALSLNRAASGSAETVLSNRVGWNRAWTGSMGVRPWGGAGPGCGPGRGSCG